MQQERKGVPQPVFLEPVEDKDRRRALHTFFKQPQYAMLDTDTVTEQTGGQATGCPVNSIRITYMTKVLAMFVPAREEQRIVLKLPMLKRKRGRGGGRAEWPAPGLPYLRFVLYKENMDTQAPKSDDAPDSQN